MRLVLVGADFEENLGIGCIAAAAEGARHRVDVLPFNLPSEVPAIVRRVVASAPDVVGLSMQFQHRAHEFVTLARGLRAAGYRGHITAGGQFPSLAWKELLELPGLLDSIVLYDGEHTTVELMSALGRGAAVDGVAGLAVRGTDGVPVRTADRPLVDDLDQLPFPRRYRAHTRHLGVPFIPLMASRGCWGKCSYCSITTVLRDARTHGGGKSLRLRSPKHVATEMALLSCAAGETAIFCFHDDNFLLPRPADTIARVRAIREGLDELDVGKVAIVGKARPDCVTADLAKELAALGVIRLYVGVENASEHGAAGLRRGAQGAHVRDALRACREAGIFVCYNLLVFEPDTTLDDVRENVQFIRDHASHPMNFCRAEPYYGTPLHRDLVSRGTLGGSWLGYDYRLDDPRAELLFRISAAAFRERNFSPDGVANRYMGIGYSNKVLEFFYDDGPGGKRAALGRRCEELTRAISLETAAYLEEAIALAADADLADRDRVERETALLGLRVAASDARWHVSLDELYADLSAVAERAMAPRQRSVPARKLLEVAQKVALGASLAVFTVGVDGCGDAVDPAPGDAGYDAGTVVDPPPRDAGIDAGSIVDPPPVDAGVDAPMIADPPPPDAGYDAGIMVVDPAPIDGGMTSLDEPARKRLELIDQWRDSAPRRAVRGHELPLFDPPAVAVRMTPADDGAVRVALVGQPAACTTRWEADGSVVGEGTEVLWTPASPVDRLRVAVRSKGGIAVVSVRAKV